MKLDDLLNQVADDADVSMLPGPAEIHHAGELRRARHRRRVVAAAVAVVTVTVTVLASVAGGDRPARPLPARGLDDWHVTRSIDVPRWGAMVYANDRLWVVDAKNRRLTKHGTAPAGEMYQIDPASGDVVSRIPEAVGGWPGVGGGDIWLSTAAGDLNVLTRVDMATHTVTRISTAADHPLPHGAAFADGSVWVANTVDGDLVRLDPVDGTVTSRIHVGSDGKGESPVLPVAIGDHVWVSTSNGQVVGIDAGTGTVVSRLQLPAQDVGLLASHGNSLYAASGNALFEVDVTSARQPRLERELRLNASAAKAAVAAAAFAAGSLWVAQVDPDALVRIDPVRFGISGRIPLAGVDRGSPIAVALAAGRGDVWVRIQGQVLELTR